MTRSVPASTLVAAARAAPGRIDNLQFLRGVAATLVVVDHLLERLVRRDVYPDSVRFLAWSLGGTGVQVFFAISGFVMFYISTRRFDSAGASAGFLLRRSLRIAPLYYLTTFCFIVFAYAVSRDQGTFGAREVLLSLAFLPYEDAMGLIQPVYALGWTLNYEMFFYVLFAAAMRLGRVAAVGVLAAALVLLSGLGAVAGDVVPGTWFRFYTSPILLYFVAGLMLAFVRQELGWRLRVPVSNVSVCGLATVAIVLACLVAPPFGPVLTVSGLAACTLLEARRPSPGFDRVSVFLGDVSYSLYLVHSFVLGAAALLIARLAGGSLALSVLGMMLAVAVSVFAAWLAHVGVEAPVQRSTSGWLSGRKGRGDTRGGELR